MIPPEFIEPTRVLDQGFIRLVRVDGDDGSIVEAALACKDGATGRSAHVWHPVGPPADALGECAVCGEPWAGAANYPACLEGDRQVIRAMMQRNMAPFAFASITVHVRCPVSVLVALPPHFDFGVWAHLNDALHETPPAAWCGAHGEAVTTWPDGFCPADGYSRNESLFASLRDPATPPDATRGPGAYLRCREDELHALSLEVCRERVLFGVDEEQARKDLPLSTYVDVFATVRVRDLLTFLGRNLTAHDLAQQAYAEAFAEIGKAAFPLTWEAFVDYRVNAVTFSGPEIQALRNFFEGVERGGLLDGGLLDLLGGAARMSTQERADFLAALGMEVK